MSTPASDAPPAPLPVSRPARLSLGPWAVVALLLVAIATVAGALAASPALAAAPVLVAALVWLGATLPLRTSSSALLLAVLVVDTRLEDCGQWRTPLVFLGDLLHVGVDKTLGIPGPGITGIEIAVVFLLAVRAYRAWVGDRADAGRGEAASAIGPILALYTAAVLASEALGLARGLPVAPWKLRVLLLPVLLVVLFLAAYRGPRDHRMLGRLVIGAACARAALAVVVQWRATADTGGHFAYATSHGDSILFAVGLFLVVWDLLLTDRRGRFLRSAPLAALIVLGAVMNGRRTFWVMLGVMMLTGYVVSPLRGWKRQLTRVAAVTVPIAALYLAIGWNRTGAPFGPAQTLRGIVDSRASRSSYWREVENWNIAVSMRAHPLLGAGLGGEYVEHMANDSISVAYKEYREWPHNSHLGLLLLMGPLGFTAFSAFLGLGAFLAYRSYRATGDPELRLAALGCLAAFIGCSVMAWSDLGPNSSQYKLLGALGVAVAAKLAVATGAWPSRRLSRAGAAPG